MLIDRAGLAVGDGATHHGIFDVAFLSHVPNMTLLAPMSYESLGWAIDYANAADFPVAIRYPNSHEPSEIITALPFEYKSGVARVRSSFDKGSRPSHVFITYGTEVCRVCEACRELGPEVGIILLETLKPYGEVAELVAPMISGAERVVFAEEGIRYGGAAMLLRDALSLRGFDFIKTEYIISAIDDNFASPKDACDLYAYVGLDKHSLIQKMNSNEEK
jgi:1-deoxy-D-xylulose-5-phosphate synthase